MHKKMTGTASSRGRIFNDFDSYKNQDWLRRRKLRIEQVRKQSKEIAKALRQKVENEEKLKAKVYARLEEEKFKCWRAEKLDEMERKLRYALEEFGLGHKLAVAEAPAKELIEAKNRVNLHKALERGVNAQQEETKKKRMEEEMKHAPIHRKRMTRKVEDLRSALICSVSAQRQVLLSSETNTNMPEPDWGLQDTIAKPTENRIKGTHENSKKNFKDSFMLDEPVNDQPKEVKCRNHINEPSLPLTNANTIWINLNDVQISSRTSDKKSYITRNKATPSEIQKPVEFYNYHARYNCKTFREYDNLVERIDYDGQNNPAEERENDEKIEKLENIKKMKARLVSEERGNEALRREKIKRDYENLIAKLEDLSKKEKLIKAQQPYSSAVLYMTDDRLNERERAKQRVMNSKFESIYYEAAAELPTRKPFPEPSMGAGDVASDIGPGEGCSAKLSFSPPNNVKPNTPVSTETEKCSTYVQTSPIQSAPMKKKKKKFKKKLLSDIDRALREGRKLRETLMHVWDENCENEKGGECTDSVTEAETRVESATTNTSFICESKKEEKGRDVLDQEAQTDIIDLPNDPVVKLDKRNVDLVDFATQVTNDTLPSNISTSTSYMSPPSQISCHTLLPIFSGLENSHDIQEHLHLNSNSRLRQKVEGMLNDLLCETSEGPSKKGATAYSCNPELNYYIKKLLNMSRECVANLSISSDNNSILNPTDPDGVSNRTSEKSVEESVCACSEKSHSTVANDQEYNKSHQVPCLEKEPSTTINNQPHYELNGISYPEDNLKKWKALLERTERRLCKSERPLSPVNEARRNFISVVEEEDEEEEELEKDLVEQEKNVVEVAFEHGDEDNYFGSKCEKEEDEKDAEVQTDESMRFRDSTKSQNNLDAITEKCSKRISELTDLLSQVRRDKEMLIESARSGSSGSNRSQKNEPIHFEEGIQTGFGTDHCRFSSITDLISRCNEYLEENASTIAGSAAAESQDGDASLASTETFPDVMSELLDKRMITSPFKWCEGDFSKELETISEQEEKTPSIQTVIGDFRKRISRIKPFSLSSSGAIRCSPPVQEVFEMDVKEEVDPPLELDLEREISLPQQPERLNFDFSESADNTIDNALRNLGLGWAKSFLKKLEESKAMSSSTCSDEKKSIIDAEGNYY